MGVRLGQISLFSKLAFADKRHIALCRPRGDSGILMQRSHRWSVDSLGPPPGGTVTAVSYFREGSRPTAFAKIRRKGRYH